ncbi:MAG: acetylornithine deacetylase [Pseudomonadota bacterium]
MTDTLRILERLIAFDSVSLTPNRDLMDYVAEELAAVGVTPLLLWNEDGTRGNLYATIGPDDRAGVMLSGHTDVVPVVGQNWTRPPFRLTREGNRLYGRGTADMKGFVAAALAAALRAARRDLALPLHLAFSYDEEIGCVGVRSLIDHLNQAPVLPRFCIVGEPTSMEVVTGHKGKTGFRITCQGREAHSALPSLGINAIHMAAACVAEVAALQERIKQSGPRDEGFDEPTTTLQVSVIEGGTALNIVPNRCELKAEIRTLAQDDPAALLKELADRFQAIARAASDEAGSAMIGIEIIAAYPGLDVPGDAEVVRFLKGLTGANSTTKVAFGTEGGLFHANAGVPTAICGPGSMAQGHKPDEFVTEDQLARCDRMLDRLIGRLDAGELPVS